MMWLIAEAFATGMPEQKTMPLVADEQSAIMIGVILGCMALLSIVVGWGVTKFAKQWRKDHDGVKRKSSESALLSATVAAIAFLGIWYCAYTFGLITTYDWVAANILAAITGIICPWSFNPIIAKIRSHWPEVADAIDRKPDEPGQ